MVAKHPFLCLLWVVSLGALLFTGLNQPVPIRTEGLRIAIAEEMTQSGNWVVPHLWGEPILTKPPGFYWALSIAQSIGGAHSLAVMRMVSVLGLIGIAISANWYLGFGGERRISGYAVYLTSLAATMASIGQVPSAEMDIPFSFWILWFWMLAIDLGTKGIADSTEKFLIRVLGLGLLGGVSVLFKWTAPAFFLPAWLWLMLFSPMSRKRKFLGSILCALGICVLPGLWMGAVVWQVEWRVLQDAIMSEALPHLSPVHHTRSYPFAEWITFPIQIVAMSLPAALPLVLPLFSKGAETIKLMIKPWPFVLAGSLLIWTLIPGHRPRHALPIPLGLAILSVPMLRKFLEVGSTRLVGVGVILLVLGIIKGILSFGTANQRTQLNQLVESAHEMEVAVGGETLGLDRIKEDGFVWLTRIPNVTRISDDKFFNWILSDQNQKDKWISKGFEVHNRAEFSRHSILTLLFREQKP